MSGEARCIRKGDWVAAFNEQSALVALGNGERDFVSGPSRPVTIEVGAGRYDLVAPASMRGDEDSLRVEYQLADARLTVVLEYRFAPVSSGAALECSVTLLPTAPIERDVSVRFPGTISIGEQSTLFAPRKNGVAYIGRGGPMAGHFAWELAGATRTYLGGYAEPLGLPLVSERAEGSPWRLTWCTDPTFTTAFFLAPRSLCDAPERELNWRYLGAVPLTEPEQRRVYACLHTGDEASAINAFYETALADVPPGPAWLHEIALIHYDYLSKAGAGWFEDVDTLAQRIEPEDRGKVCLCLHGWYDQLGRYCMDTDRREIEHAWTLVRGHDLSGQAGLELTRDQVTAMLRYARERGFRTTLYYGDGLIATAEWAAETFTGDAVLRSTGWDEGASHSVLLNPLHPEVRAWFLDYTRALTRAFGDDVDGFVWDETYFFPAGELGPASGPGYVDRAFMTLMREITAIVHEHRSDLAFLGSDNAGVSHYCDGTGRASVAYSLVADGCWQDSACSPEGWPYALFPNFRNVTWSCNWSPVENFDAMEYGADNFGTPAVTTNGFGENRALSEYPDGALDRILDVFRRRAEAPRTPFWLTPGDPRIAGPVGTHPAGIHIASPTGG